MIRPKEFWVTVSHGTANKAYDDRMRAAKMAGMDDIVHVVEKYALDDANRRIDALGKFVKVFDPKKWPRKTVDFYFIGTI
jgi:hypothetical protein